MRRSGTSTPTLGPTTKLAFDTAEGTWMNLDVSPDGRQIVFDLLGDIYVMPIGGSDDAGEADRQRAGLRHAAALQPRRQAHRLRQRSRRPLEHLDDGYRREGREADLARAALVRQQPDVVARRRLHLRAPALRQGALARRRRDLDVSLRRARATVCRSPSAMASRKTPASPTFRPTAATSITVTTSRRARPSNTTRTRTARSTRSCGAISSPAASGARSACRADRSRRRSSPDGKSLAYIRRVRLQSHLFLRDLESGRDRQLFSNVDKDLQEAWAIHGLYPQYAWTPDGKSIVIWGEGKIWNVDVASGKGQQVPFVAQVEQTLNDAVRFPQKVHPDEFPVKMLRDVRVSPDGKLVVYSALGHLYVGRCQPASRAD